MVSEKKDTVRSFVKMLPVCPLFDEREDENKELLFITLMFEPLNTLNPILLHMSS
jgi:hypothetical protein